MSLPVTSSGHESDSQSPRQLCQLCGSGGVKFSTSQELQKKVGIRAVVDRGGPGLHQLMEPRQFRSKRWGGGGVVITLQCSCKRLNEL